MILVKIMIICACIWVSCLLVDFFQTGHNEIFQWTRQFDTVSGTGCPSIRCSKTFNVGHYMQTFGPNSCIPGMLLVIIVLHIWYHFHLPWPGLGVAQLAESKTCLLYLWHAFQLIRIMVVQAIQVGHSDTTLSEMHGIKGNNCCITD